jgi:hypothetical protein
VCEVYNQLGLAAPTFAPNSTAHDEHGFTRRSVIACIADKRIADERIADERIADERVTPAGVADERFALRSTCLTSLSYPRTPFLRAGGQRLSCAGAQSLRAS